jgi:hypothetical protein
MGSARGRIRTLNDMLRILRTGGEVIITPGVAALPAMTLLKLDVQLTAFVDFNEANDPYGEHDFGAMKVEGQTFFFKIDAYDLSGQFGSPDPADPAVTKRVMTIMRADEY